jgi:hypothetical protein
MNSLCCRKVASRIALLALALAGFAVTSRAADFNITSPGFFFSINGTNSSGNPTLVLVRGRTYTFSLGTSGIHPFRIATSVGGATPAGVTGNNGGSTGTITFAVPTNAANCVYYCTVHLFTGNIVMVDPPPPPTINIVGLQVGSNLTVTSTLASTNGWTLTPEFSTNLLSSNWAALTVQSNKFVNGTNEVICGRPGATNVFVRMRAQAN